MAVAALLAQPNAVSWRAWAGAGAISNLSDGFDFDRFDRYSDVGTSSIDSDGKVSYSGSPRSKHILSEILNNPGINAQLIAMSRFGEYFGLEARLVSHPRAQIARAQHNC